MRQQHTLQPKLRFPEFEGDWKEFKFIDLYEFKTTNSLSRDRLNYEIFNVKNIHYGDIHTKFKTLFDITKENVPFINKNVDLSKISLDNYVQVGDVIIADASENYEDIGKSIEVINLNNERVISGLHTFLARKITALNYNGFISNVFKTNKYRHQIYRIAQGTKVLSLSSNRVGNLILNIPSLPEQQKIADYLSTIDTKINLLEEKKEQLTRYKKAMMQKLFSQEIRFKDENGNDFGEWEEKKISEIFEFKQGVQCEIEQQYLNRKEGQYRFVRIIDLTNPSEKPRYIYHNNIKDVISKNELFMVRYGTPGLIGYGYEGVIANNLFRLIPKIKLETKFYKYYLEYLRLEILSLSSSTSMPAISFKSLNFLTLFYLSILEQQKIADFLSAIDESIEKVNEQITQTQSFKKAMLQQMFV